MDGPTSSISLGKIAEPPALSICRNDALVIKGAEMPKPRLSPVEVRMLSSATGGLLPAGTTSTTMKTIFPLPPLSWSLRETKEMKKYTSATNYRFNLNQLALLLE